MILVRRLGPPVPLDLNDMSREIMLCHLLSPIYFGSLKKNPTPQRILFPTPIFVFCCCRLNQAATTLATPVSRSLGAVNFGQRTPPAGNMASRISPKSERDLIYDDCPGGRALAAQAAAAMAAAQSAADSQTAQQQQYGFHSLPHYHHSSFS